jgi:hypothetical protein
MRIVVFQMIYRRDYLFHFFPQNLKEDLLFALEVIVNVGRLALTGIGKMDHAGARVALFPEKHPGAVQDLLSAVTVGAPGRAHFQAPADRAPSLRHKIGYPAATVTVRTDKERLMDDH